MVLKIFSIFNLNSVNGVKDKSTWNIVETLFLKMNNDLMTIHFHEIIIHFEKPCPKCSYVLKAYVIKFDLRSPNIVRKLSVWQFFGYDPCFSLSRNLCF